jgi:hypothetical protein
MPCPKIIGQPLGGLADDLQRTDDGKDFSSSVNVSDDMLAVKARAFSASSRMSSR